MEFPRNIRKEKVMITDEQFRRAEQEYERRIDELCSSCEPKVISAEKQYECRDEEGNIEYSIDYTYNCEYCTDKECEYWDRFNN